MDAPVAAARLQKALAAATAALLARRAPQGHWVGELSSSALSTATAVTALAVVARERPGSEVQGLAFKAQTEAGLAWLAAHANADGGWGDTPRSLSNLSTTTLVWAAFGAVPQAQQRHQAAVRAAERWLQARLGSLAPDQLARAIIARYGKDRTFSVPILTLCALAGRLGSGREAWRQVLPLPFELAALPHQWFAALRLPVVSYALPALIAIGQVRHHHAPPPNPLVRAIRNLARAKTLRVLTGIQPANGGFLEATPLTSFVVMSLAGCGRAEHLVCRRGLEFLLRSQRADGSWPIDTNLATWLSTLAVNGLGELLPADAGCCLRAWLLAQQHRAEHPYTHAAPGGWAWTNLPGGVPDADDTAGAVLALRRLGPAEADVRASAQAGLRWLLDLQNRDGGVPTFCRGWGALPFDRSSADLTAHALRAWLAWLEDLPPALRARTGRAVRRAIAFLARTQRPDGSWAPLWFGNQFAPGEQNPTYGTARVLCGLTEVLARPELRSPLASGLCDSAANWLVRAQNADGGWGGASQVEPSVEETALAVEALAARCQLQAPGAKRHAGCLEALQRGVAWLVERVESGAWEQPAPIGFYFARLWYFERLYPLVFTVAALRRAAQVLGA